MSELSFITYKQLKVLTPTPLEEAGQVLNDNFSIIDDQLELLNLNASELLSNLDSHLNNENNPHATTYSQVGAAPTIHTHDDRYYTESEINTFLLSKVDSSIFTSHTSNESNPHNVTKTQVGLPNVVNNLQLIASNNLSDLPSPSSARNSLGLGSAATQSTAAFDLAGSANTVQLSLNSHIANNTNPHSTTKVQVGLGNVINSLQLVAANNLSDLVSIVTSRANLGLGSVSTHDFSEFSLISHNHDDRYYTESEINSLFGNLDLSNYYTKTQIDTSLNGKSNTIHSHVIADIANLQTALNSKINSAGDILPTSNNQNIGSASNKFNAGYFREIYLDESTLYIGDTPIIGTSGDTVLIKADANQSINVQTSGTGITTVSSVNGAEISVSGLNADVKIQSTGSGGRVVMGATSSVAITSPLVSMSGDSTISGNLQVTNLTVTGNATVLGDSFIVNASTVNVEDNIIVVNSGEVGDGVTKGQAGLRVDRGDAPDYLMVFDEVQDRFMVGEIGSLQVIASQNYVTSQIGSSLSSYYTKSQTDVLIGNIDLSTKASLSGATFSGLVNFNLGLSVTGKAGINTSSPRTTFDITTTSIDNTSTVGTFVVSGVDSYGQTFTLQAPVTNYSGNILQSFKGNGPTAQAILMGAHFNGNIPDKFVFLDPSLTSLFEISNTGGDISWRGVATGNGSGLTNLNAGNLTGTVATARLGSGTANSTTYLRGDGTWAIVAAGHTQNTDTGTTSTTFQIDSGNSGSKIKNNSTNGVLIRNAADTAYNSIGASSFYIPFSTSMGSSGLYDAAGNNLVNFNGSGVMALTLGGGNISTAGTIGATTVNVSGTLSTGNRINLGGSASAASFHSGSNGILFKPSAGDRALMEIHSPTGGTRGVIQAVDGYGLFIQCLSAAPTIFDNNFAGSYEIINGSTVDRGLRFASTGGSGDVGIGRASAGVLQITDGSTGLGNIIASNLSGTNTGDQDLSGYTPKTGATLTGGIVFNVPVGNKALLFKSQGYGNTEWGYVSDIAEAKFRQIDISATAFIDGSRALLNPGFKIVFTAGGVYGASDIAQDVGLTRSGANKLKVTNGSSGLGSIEVDTITANTVIAPVPTHNHDDRYYTESEVNSLIEQVELTPGPKGDTGDQGPQGPYPIVAQNEPPTNLNVLWIDTNDNTSGGGGGFKYIGDEEPDTSDWNENDIWYDTSTEVE